MSPVAGGGIDRGADERVLFPALCPPWRAPNPAHDLEAGEIDIGTGEHTTSPRVAPPNPALRGRRHDRPRGRRARPVPRIASCPPPWRTPNSARDAEVGEIDIGAGEAHHIPPVSRRLTNLVGPRPLGSHTLVTTSPAVTFSRLFSGELPRQLIWSRTLDLLKRRNQQLR